MKRLILLAASLLLLPSCADSASSPASSEESTPVSSVSTTEPFVPKGDLQKVFASLQQGNFSVEYTLSYASLDHDGSQEAKYTEYAIETDGFYGFNAVAQGDHSIFPYHRENGTIHSLAPVLNPNSGLRYEQLADYRTTFRDFDLSYLPTEPDDDGFYTYAYGQNESNDAIINSLVMLYSSGSLNPSSVRFQVIGNSLIAHGIGLVYGEGIQDEVRANFMQIGTTEINDVKNFLEEGPYRRVAEAPFDSERKMMSTIHTDPDGGYVQFTKGAPDVLLSRCTMILDNGKIREMTDDDRKAIMGMNKEFADKALRVLAGAMKKLDEIPSDTSPSAIEKDLIFLGLSGMIDPVRPEVKAAIKECRSAGIRPIMITGDHIDTAVAIGKELGIVKDRSEAITGAELDKLSDDEFQKNIRKYSIYARVQPEHKVRIVKGWQQAGMITAMTGDGVNDAPSIKNADIGVGMGITGTDVTKNVADMVLADDNFATIVVAVEEGRKIYDNIRKAIQFLLSSNLAEVISVFVASMMGITLLKPAHLLWINLITDCFPAVGLGMEQGDPDIMNRPPRSSKEGIFAGGLGVNCLIQGIALSIITIASYIIGEIFENGAFHLVTSEDGMTMAFLTLSMAELFHSFNMRSLDKSLFRIKGHNKILYWTLIGAFVLTLAVLYIPFLNDAFGFAHISFTEFVIALLIAVLIIPIVEIQKAILKRIQRKSN